MIEVTCRYAPSFLTRFNLQFLIVAIPWILQVQGQSLQSIGQIMTYYYSGSLVAGWLVFHFVKNIQLRRQLILLNWLNVAICIAALLSGHFAVVAVCLLLQGSMLGVIRPLSRLWFLEVSESESHPRSIANKSRVVSQSSYAEMFVTIGMSLGGLLAWALAKNDVTNPWTLLGASICLVIPVAVCTGLMLMTPRLRKHPQALAAVTESSVRRWLNSHSSVWKCVVLYGLSVLVFKLWIIRLPFELRQIFPTELDHSILSMGLALHPIGFLSGQILASRWLNRFDLKREDCVLFIAGLSILQVLGTEFSLMAPSIGLAVTFILLSGGFFAGFIYPMVIHTLKGDLDGSSKGLKRKILFTLSMAADVGQLTGAMALGADYGHWTHQGILGLIVVVLVVVFFPDKISPVQLHQGK